MNKPRLIPINPDVPQIETSPSHRFFAPAATIPFFQSDTDTSLSSETSELPPSEESQSTQQLNLQGSFVRTIHKLLLEYSFKQAYAFSKTALKVAVSVVINTLKRDDSVIGIITKRICYWLKQISQLAFTHFFNR